MDHCTYTAPDLSCTLPYISAGSTLNYKLDYTVGASLGTGAFFEGVLPREYDLDPDNNAKVHAVVVDNQSDVELTASATATAVTSAPVSFVATIRNNGPDSTPGATLKLTLPAGIGSLSATTTAGLCGTTTVGQQTWTASLVGSGSKGGGGGGGGHDWLLMGWLGATLALQLCRTTRRQVRNL